MAEYNPKEWTRKHEGFKDHYYFDSQGRLTIGVGHLLTPKSKYYDKELISKAEKIFESVGNNPAKANKLLNTKEFKRDKEDLLKTYDKDYEYHAKMAEDVFPNFKKHPQNVQDALINMTFQLGNKPKKWNQLQHNLQIGLETGDYKGAASAAAHSLWFKNQTAKRARSVLDRMAFGTEYAYNSSQPEKYGSKDINNIYGSYNATKNKNVHSSIKIIDDAEPEESSSLFDNITEFVSSIPEMFSFSAQASDVPPMETVKPPVPTNPEAGPSDTVPAMLTEGEAVIPASAAQNPENKKNIQELLVEGRVKNDIAESNGVPVTSQALAEIPKERLYENIELDEYHRRNLTGKYGGGEQSLQGFAGGTMDIPKGMHMMPDGSLMKDEDHKGYGHGIMDVPAMVMMAPPKDPTMDEMEKLALKQMGYEMKSKNRTRDTIEKIGLKHLEDTATAEMRQAALDETMRNYGLEVPMPMQKVPQGFYMGSDGVQYKDKETADLYAALTAQQEGPQATSVPENFGSIGEKTSSLIRGVTAPVAGEKTSPYRDMEDFELLEAAQSAQTPVEEDALYKELENRREAVPTGSEVTRVDPTQPIKVAGSDVTIAPPKPVQPQATPVVNTRKETKDSNKGKGNGNGNGNGNESEFLKNLKGGIGKAFSKVFDPESIATAGIYYGVNKLLGYDNDVAAKQAAIGYASAQKDMRTRMANEVLDERQKKKAEATASAAKAKALAKRRESAIANQIKIDEYGQKTLRTALSDTGLKVSDSPTLVSYVSSELSAVVDQFGLDLSDPSDFRAAQQLIPSVMQKFVEGLKGDAENMVPGAMSTAVDQVMLQRRELGNAFEGVSPKAAGTIFNKIKSNIARERKTSDTGFVDASFEDRVAHAHRVFSQFTEDQINSLGLRAPSEGENTFIVFLEKMLSDQDNLMKVE